MSTKSNDCDLAEANLTLLQNVLDSDEGTHKSASAAGTDMIRKSIKEASLLRRYCPLVMKSQSDLVPSLTHDQPCIIEWMEEDALGAAAVPFGVNQEIEFFYQKKFDIKFDVIQTPQWQKNIYELMSVRGVDYAKMIIDNGLRKVHDLEDTRWLQAIYSIVGDIGGVGMSGYPQHFAIHGGISKDTYPEVLNGIEDFDLNNNTIIMNRRTAKAFLKWPRDEIGGDLAEKLTKDGMGALEDNVLFGCRHLFSIKRDLIPDGRVIVLTDPNYFMRYYGLQDLTMHVEKRKYMIKSDAMQVTGMAFANLFGAVVYDFV